VDVLSRKLSSEKWARIKPVLGSLLRKAEYTPIYYLWRPASPDPGDEHLIDCAMNASAALVTENVRDFAAARDSLGLTVFTPITFIKLLAE
jgi:hypothetical protein